MIFLRPGIFLVIFSKIFFDKVVAMKASCKKSTNEISRQLDENVMGKLTYLPRLLKMEVSDKEETLLVNTGIPSDMFNVACLIEDCSYLQPIYDMFRANHLPFAWWAGFKDNGIKCRETIQKSGMKESEVETGMFIDIEAMKLVPAVI